MRTTFTLDNDVAAEVERLRRSEGIGISEAVNRLIRAGLTHRPPAEPYLHRSTSLGLKVDITSIASVLELLDDEA
jgi:Ribbon-helix-helix protein, copG family